ncbi:MBL fold metallo-hydrolase [Hydrogenibacillus schlegelii]|uniref:Rhodanese domain-containing protein n=1 Tax=Hydrogenibacillus schlegelii TaxID=1484 RepID=A0A132MGF2_HYDSH|nr:MBL fold metallo-hydrolase [Hydrogenibacillus schlegelii]KWW96859.1 hypothetical protein TR75_11650 [Hydrogenibacillus schlegelii]OAR03830.1 hypothetical protein SA87_03010 [Hydrogenibacillus schlegelii]
MVQETKPVPTIPIDELVKRMHGDEDVFILDVRNADDYAGWKIEGERVRSVNIPYFDFLDDDESVFARLPKDKEIHVVCAKGGSSAYVTELLTARGYRAVSVEGGMEAWSQSLHPVVVHEDDKLKVIQFNRLGKGCLSYFIVSEGEALVVDALRRVDFYEDFARQNGWTIRHVVDTHIHADHISGGRRLADRVGAPYFVSSHDIFTHQGALRFEPLEQHKTLRVGAVDVDVIVIPTPGHTPGSTSLLVDNRFFLSGDTVFVSGLGRPDLGGKVSEWAQDLYDTVSNKLKALSDDVIVLPAHYSHHTEINARGVVGARLGDLRRINELLREIDRKAFTAAVEASASTERPPNFEKIIAINVGKLTVAPEEEIELEIGPNRCAVHHATA